MISVEEALKRITDRVPPVGQENVPLLKADGRTLGRDLPALTAQPPFDASAMDGYAVIAADVASLPAKLKVIGEAAAGLGFKGKIGRGEAVRIFTGAPLPAGADAIVIQENTSRNGDRLTVNEGRPDAAHIRHRGMDFVQGACLLKAGIRLTPRLVTLAAAMGHSSLPVRRKPTIALVATGDELVLPGDPRKPEQIFCSNPFGIAGIIQREGGQAEFIGIVPDDRERLAELCKTGRDADILVTIGGASVGDHDIVAPALQSMGMELDFWRIAMRPGKPLMFGRLGKTRVIGLPGNPVSSLICTKIFVVPLIKALLGHASTALALRKGVITEALPPNGPRQHYMRATCTYDGGDYTVTPVSTQDSSLLSPLAVASALIVRPPHHPAVSRGGYVTLLPLDF
ncbi:MAG: gephyrin-like molybdotransferase Glp [Pseudomonadota bacterium]